MMHDDTAAVAAAAAAEQDIYFDTSSVNRHTSHVKLNM
jgi:hypothetical protein